MEIPFPQRDLHLRSVDDNAAVKRLKSTSQPQLRVPFLSRHRYRKVSETNDAH